jgi:hypothetical protein
VWIRGWFEAIRPYRCLEILRRDFARGVDVALVGIDLGLGQIKTDGLELLAKLNGQWQAYVPQTDNSQGGGLN